MARLKMFKNLTLREKFILYFKLNHKAEIVDGRSSKLTMKFTHVNKTFDETVFYVFLGKSGSVRLNVRNAVTTSTSKTELYTNKLLQSIEEGTMQRLYEAGVLTLD